MRYFADLYDRVECATGSAEKVHILRSYFEKTADEDKLWAIALLSDRKPKRVVSAAQMRTWAMESARLPDWLFEESYQRVGDLAETIALTTYVNSVNKANERTLTETVKLIIAIRSMSEGEKKDGVQKNWRELDQSESFIFNKLLAGSFRTSISNKELAHSLALVTGAVENEIAYRLHGKWDPQTVSFNELVQETNPESIASKPYPFIPLQNLDRKIEELGAASEWQAAWKWAGVPAHLILRENNIYVWTQEGELVTERYPEFSALVDELPQGIVLEGEILAFNEGAVLDFRSLEKRLSRKLVSVKTQKEVPVIFMIYDLLEWESEDIRHEPLQRRRKKLDSLVLNARIQLAPQVDLDSWESLRSIHSCAREKRCQGIVLSRQDASNEASLLWKAEALSTLAVLTFAARGDNGRAKIYSEYTFGLWRGEELVTFAKTNMGLSDEEVLEIHAYVQNNTLERFGPVRQIKAELIFEISFEDIVLSKRHRSGVSVSGTKILRWRRGKVAMDVDRIEDLMRLVHTP